MTSNTTGVPVSTTACSSSSWRPGSSSDDRERHLADHVLPLTGDDDRDIRSAREVDGSLELGVLVEPLGIFRRVPSEHVEQRGEHALHDAHTARVIDPHPVSGPGADAFQHGDRLVEVEVEDPWPDGVALGVGQRPDDRDRAQAAGVEW